MVLKHLLLTVFMLIIAAKTDLEAGNKGISIFLVDTKQKVSRPT
jgi:alkylation response protein AidB-like acyl-CoA dehydrogenase